MLPDSINNLDGAMAANLVSRVEGTMEDVYGHSFPIDLTFDWAPWVEKLTDAKRRSYGEPDARIVKALGDIKKEIHAALRRLDGGGRH